MLIDALRSIHSRSNNRRRTGSRCCDCRKHIVSIAIQLYLQDPEPTRDLLGLLLMRLRLNHTSLNQVVPCLNGDRWVTAWAASPNVELTLTLTLGNTTSSYVNFIVSELNLYANTHVLEILG